MNEQEMNTSDQATEQEPTPRPWVTPTFEKVELKKALTGSPNFYAFDGNFYYS